MTPEEILGVLRDPVDPGKVLHVQSEVARMSVADKHRLKELANADSAKQAVKPSPIEPATLVPAEVEEVDDQIAKTVELAVPEVVAEEKAEEAVLPVDNQPSTSADSREAFITEPAEKPPTASEAEGMEDNFFAD